jgi:hypothetical protein
VVPFDTQYRWTVEEGQDQIPPRFLLAQEFPFAVPSPKIASSPNTPRANVKL